MLKGLTIDDKTIDDRRSREKWKEAGSSW